MAEQPEPQFEVVPDQALKPGEWLIVTPSTRTRIFGDFCLHMKSWIDTESGNMHHKTYGHIVTEGKCNVPKDEIPEGADA